MCADGQVLAAFLEAERQRTSLREMETRTGVPRTTLDNLIKRRNVRLPELETLQKLAAAFNLPLWKVAEMAGVDVGLPRTADGLAQRLAALAQTTPQLAALLDDLTVLPPDELAGVVAYIEARQRQRQQRQG